MEERKGWIGVDFDGTLSRYEGWQGKGKYGPPIPAMVDRVKKWLSEGYKVKVVTARAEDPKEAWAVGVWCEDFLGMKLEVTQKKDFDMIELWDDRAVRVAKNTGEQVSCSDIEGDPHD